MPVDFFFLHTNNYDLHFLMLIFGGGLAVYIYILF